MNRPGPHSFQATVLGLLICSACGLAMPLDPEGKKQTDEPCPISAFPWRDDPRAAREREH